MPSATETGYAERDEAAYTSFTALRGRLLGEKGGRFQRNFLMAAKTSDNFVALMDKEVATVEGRAVVLFTKPITEQSFKEMTVDQEQTVYALWRDVPPRIACRVSFWAEVTLQHLREGVMEEAYWLAANGGRNESGEERIDRALAESGERGNKMVDDCVRTILRRMSGLPAARGNRSVFVNCSFGRAWWRERLVARIIDEHPDGEERTALLNVVRASQQYWENLVTMIVSRGSVFGSSKVQDALVNGLAAHLRVDPASPLRNATALAKVLRRFSNIAASRELGILAFEEICGVVDALLKQISHSLAKQEDR